MFHEVADDPGALTADELYSRYAEALAEAVESVGVEAVAEESGLDRETVEAVASGDPPELTLKEGAAILAAREDTPDAETIAQTDRDALLLGMTNAVLDVEAVEAGVGGELEAREIQSKVEGRFPMTLREFALLRQFVEGKTP